MDKKYDLIRVYTENRAMFIWKLATHVINQLKLQHLD